MKFGTKKSPKRQSRLDFAKVAAVTTTAVTAVDDDHEIDDHDDTVGADRIANADNTTPMLKSSYESFGLCGCILIVLSYFIVGITFPLSLCYCIRIVKEYERAVIYRLGRILPGGAKGPGLFFILPCADNIETVDLRTVTFDVPPQEILTKDSVTISVDAVCYFRIFDPIMSINNVSNAKYSTRLLAATSLRNILGTKTLQEILQDRELIAHRLQHLFDAATEPWGVKVERIEVKDVRLPTQMQRAMATEAEATREARAKVVSAEGEQKASVALREAADTINRSPIALQLRYLQTLTHIAAEKNSTIIFPIPIEFLRSFVNSTPLQTPSWSPPPPPPPPLNTTTTKRTMIHEARRGSGSFVTQQHQPPPPLTTRTMATNAIGRQSPAANGHSKMSSPSISPNSLASSNKSHCSSTQNRIESN